MNIVIIIVAVILVLIIQAILLKRGNRGITAEIYTDKTGAEPDEPFRVTLRLRNDSYLIRPFVGFEIIFPRQIHIISDIDTTDCPPYSLKVSGSAFLWPKGTAERTVEASFDARGRYRFGSIILKTGDFLGLREETSDINIPQSVSIYPKRLEGADISRVTGGIMGDMPVRRFIFEDPVLFSGFREYTGREPMKDISWLQSARTGQLMVRQYDHTAHTNAMVILDTYDAEPSEAEVCFSITRDVCTQLDDAGIEYGLYMNAELAGAAAGGNYMAPGMGTGHLYGIMMQLANALYTCRYTDEKLIDGIKRNIRQTTGIIYITPASEKREQALKGALPPELMESITIISASDFMNRKTEGEDRKWA